MIVVAIPTIKARGDAWEDVAQAWQDMTPEPVLCVPSWREGGWAQGLNEVWEDVGSTADVFVAGSDDMIPSEGWFEAATKHLEAGECPVPTVVSDDGNRRMVTHGGTQDSYWGDDLREGAPARMTNFPIIRGDWLAHIFPYRKEAPQHYCADDYIGDCLRAAGVSLVTCLDITITHTWDERGRGSGMGDESTRLAFDREVYKRLG